MNNKTLSFVSEINLFQISYAYMLFNLLFLM